MNVARLRGLLAEKGLTQQDAAKAIGISGKTFYLKMKKGSFGTEEAESLIELLGIKSAEDKVDIFLTSK